MDPEKMEIQRCELSSLRGEVEGALSVEKGR